METIAEDTSEIPDPSFHQPASQVAQPYADNRAWVDQRDHWVDGYDWGMDSWAHGDHDETASDDEWERLKHAKTLVLGETSDGEWDGTIVQQGPKDSVSDPAELEGLDGDFSGELEQALVDPAELEGLDGDFSGEPEQALVVPAELEGLDGDFSGEPEQALVVPAELEGLDGDFFAELQQALVDPAELEGLDGDFSAELRQALLDPDELKGFGDDFSTELEALLEASGVEKDPKDPHIQQLKVLDQLFSNKGQFLISYL